MASRRGIPWSGTNRHRARSACTRSPTGPSSEATRYCIHDHRVVEDGPWNDLNSCWFNSLYTRVVPSHAIELTSALLDRRVASAIGTETDRQGHAPAEAGSGRRDPPLRSRSRPCLCDTRLPADPPPTVRRPRRAELSRHESTRRNISLPAWRPLTDGAKICCVMRARASEGKNNWPIAGIRNAFHEATSTGS